MRPSHGFSRSSILAIASALTLATIAPAVGHAQYQQVFVPCASGVNYGNSYGYSIPKESGGGSVSGFDAYGNVRDGLYDDYSVSGGYEVWPQGGTNTVRSEGLNWSWVDPRLKIRCIATMDTAARPQTVVKKTFEFTGWSGGKARAHPDEDGDCWVTIAPASDDRDVVGGPSATEAPEPVAAPTPSCDDPDDDGSGSGGGGGGETGDLYCDILVDFDPWGHIIGITILLDTCVAA